MAYTNGIIEVVDEVSQGVFRISGYEPQIRRNPETNQKYLTTSYRIRVGAWVRWIRVYMYDFPETASNDYGRNGRLVIWKKVILKKKTGPRGAVQYYLDVCFDKFFDPSSESQYRGVARIEVVPKGDSVQFDALDQPVDFNVSFPWGTSDQ